MKTENYKKDTKTDKKEQKTDEKAEKELSVEQALSVVMEFEKAIEENGWLNSAKDSWDRFRQQKRKAFKKKKSMAYPLWYATGKVRQPLIFGKTPTIVVQPIVQDKQGFINEVADFGEKFGQALLERFPFFNVMCSSRDDLLMTSLGTSRVMVDADFVYEPAKEYLEVQTVEVPNEQTGQSVPQEIIVDSEGEQVEPGLVSFDKDGRPYRELPEQMERAEKPRVFLKPVCFKEFIWDWEAKEFSEWDYCGFKSKLTRRQILKRFGQEAIELLPDMPDRADKPTGSTKFDIIELWWKPTKQRLIFARHGSKTGKDFLKTTEDPHSLENFFPISYPLFDNLGTEDSIPVTEYSAVQHILDHIDDIYDRKAQALRVSRPRGYYDSTVPELKSVLGNTRPTTKDWIGIPNLASKAQQGSTFVQVIDTSNVMAALDKYNQEFDMQIRAYDQITGFSDIVRGVTNPYETATANERKAQFAMHRLLNMQQDMQRYCRDNIRLLVDAALNHFEKDHIFELMESSLTDVQRQQFDKIVDKLKSDCWRSFHLDIETDSTILIDEDSEKAQAMELATTMGGMLVQIAQSAEQTPEAVEIGALLIELVISKFRGGKEFQNKVKQTIQMMTQGIAQRRQQGQAQGQQPTPQEQFDMQYKQQDLMMRGQKEAAAANLKARELALKERKEAREAAVAQAELNLEAAGQQLESALATQDIGQEGRKQAFTEFIERARLELEKTFKALDIQEKFMEEQRLSAKQEVPETVVIQPPMSQPQISAGPFTSDPEIELIPAGSGRNPLR